jgi:hypothetical protein
MLLSSVDSSKFFGYLNYLFAARHLGFVVYGKADVV